MNLKEEGIQERFQRLKVLNFDKTIITSKEIKTNKNENNNKSKI
jgi:hypothetical protein